MILQVAMVQARLKSMWHEVKDIVFEFIEIKGHFNCSSSFSKVDLNWDVYFERTKKCCLGIAFKDLVDFNPDNELPAHTEDTMKYITNGCKLVQWPPSRAVRARLHVVFTQRCIYTSM